MTQEDLNELLGKSLANHQLRQLAEDGGNLESALTLIDRLESELLNARAMRKGVGMTYRGRLKDWEIMSREDRQEALEQMQFLNADGEAVGYLVGNYLVGDVVDSCEEYINLEWWMPVDLLEATEEPVTTYSNGKWYNPTNQEKADEWYRRTHKKRD